MRLLIIGLLFLGSLQAQTTPVVRGSTPTSSNCLGTDSSGHVTSCSMSPASLWTGTTDPGVPPYPTIRQYNSGDSNTISFSSNVVAGNTIIAMTRCAASGPATISSNTQSITFTTAAYGAGNYFIGTALSSGAESISVGGCAFDTWFVIIEIQATSGIDGSVVTSSTGPPSLTTGTAYDTIFYLGVIPGTTTTTGASVVVYSNTNNTSLAYQNTTASGTYTSALSSGNTSWIALAYKAVPVSNPGVNGDMYLNLTTHHLWGPKAGGNWLDTNLVTPSTTVGGDLSGTIPNPTVAKVNGLAVPTSAGMIGTNSSGQFIVAPNPSPIQPPLTYTPPNLSTWSTQTSTLTPQATSTATYTAGVSANINLAKANNGKFSQLWYKTQAGYATFSVTTAVQISSDTSTNNQFRFIVASDNTFTGTPRFIAIKCNSGTWGIYADLASETSTATGVSCLVPTLFFLRIYDDGTKLHLQVSGDVGTTWVDLGNENRPFTIGAYGVAGYEGSTTNDTGILLWTVFVATT